MHKRLDATAALLALLLAASAAQAGWDHDDQPRDDRRHGEGEVEQPCSYRRGCGGSDAYDYQHIERLQRGLPVDPDYEGPRMPKPLRP